MNKAIILGIIVIYAFLFWMQLRMLKKIHKNYLKAQRNQKKDPQKFERGKRAMQLQKNIVNVMVIILVILALFGWWVVYN